MFPQRLPAGLNGNGVRLKRDVGSMPPQALILLIAVAILEPGVGQIAVVAEGGQESGQPAAGGPCVVDAVSEVTAATSDRIRSSRSRRSCWSRSERLRRALSQLWDPQSIKPEAMDWAVKTLGVDDSEDAYRARAQAIVDAITGRTPEAAARLAEVATAERAAVAWLRE